MRYLLTMIFAFFMGYAGAAASSEEVKTYVGDGMTVTLYDTPCQSEILQGLIPPEMFETAKAGDVLWEGNNIPLCYLTGEITYLIIDETGDYGTMPKDVFKIMKQKPLRSGAYSESYI